MVKKAGAKLEVCQNCVQRYSVYVVLVSVLLQFANNYSSIKINGSKHILPQALDKYNVARCPAFCPPKVAKYINSFKDSFPLRRLKNY
jgi:hypothetical protein